MDFLQGKTLMQKENESVSADLALKKKNLILYYFTAKNSEACRTFDQKLRQVYDEAILRKIELAVIVVSSDCDQQHFTENIKSNYQDWFYIKFGDELSRVLIYNYGVTHIPTLVVVRKNGTLVTREGRSDIDKIGINVLVTWSE